MDSPTFTLLEKGLRVPSGAVIDYAEVLRDIERLKEISPIDFHDAFGIQKDIEDCNNKSQLICGGNRSGKTEIIAKKVVRKCIEKKRARWWIVGETFQDSIAIQQAKVWSFLPKHLLKYGKYDQINGFTNRKVLFKNGSLIIFKSYDQQRESFQGDQIDGVWFDEECPYDIYQECRMRLIDRDGQMLISMTSLKGVTELIQDLYEDSDVLESKYAELVSEDLPRKAEKEGTKIFFLWSTENPYIPQERVKEEAALLSRDEIKSRIYGLPINLTGKVYTSMSKHVHVTEVEDMPEGAYSLYMVLDPHDRKPWAMIWIAVHKTGTAYVVDEYPNRNFNEMLYDDKTYAEYGTIIKTKEAELKELFGVSVRRRVLDPNFGNKTVQLARRQGGQSTTTPKKELHRLGFVFRDGIDAIEAGHLKVREWLHYLTSDDGEIVVQPRLMFASECVNTIRQMCRYSRKETTTPSGDEKDKVGPEEKYKDFPDCVRYGVMSNLVYAEEYEKPEEFKRVY